MIERIGLRQGRRHAQQNRSRHRQIEREQGQRIFHHRHRRFRQLLLKCQRFRSGNLFFKAFGRNFLPGRKSQGIFKGQHLPAFPVNLFFRQRTFLNCRHHSVDFLLQIPGSQQHIVACCQRLGTDIFMPCNSFHFQGIRHHQSMEMQLIDQRMHNHFFRNGSRLFAQGRRMQMPHHHPTDARFNGFLEGIQLHTVQSATIEIQFRQCFMRVDFRISVPRKMLTHRHHPPCFQAGGISHHLPSHLPGLTSERPKVDDRIIRIVIHIGHRGKIDLYSNQSALAGHFFSISIK